MSKFTEQHASRVQAYQPTAAMHAKNAIDFEHRARDCFAGRYQAQEQGQHHGR